MKLRTIPLGIALVLGLSACSPDWLRQYTMTDIEVDHIHVAVSWLLIDDGFRDVYDIHVSRAHAEAGTMGQPKLPASTARAAATQVMNERWRCHNGDLWMLSGDTALPQPTFSFRALCHRKDPPV